MRLVLAQPMHAMRELVRGARMGWRVMAVGGGLWLRVVMAGHGGLRRGAGRGAASRRLR